MAGTGDGAPRFHLRSESVSRLEGFSDTAFGFAITLLVVSLAVPTRFDAYFLVAVPKFVAGSFLGRRGRALARRQAAPARPTR